MRNASLSKRKMAPNSASQTLPAVEDRLQNRLDVRRGGGDHPEDLAGGRFPLEGLDQIAVASLQLFEEACVLDGDDGLIGECLEESDLLVRERPHLAAPDADGAKGLTFPKQWDGEHASESQRSPDGIRVFQIERRIFDVDDTPLKDGASGRAGAVHLLRICLPCGC